MAVDMSTDANSRVSEVLARLARVTDPELDEPVTELGFVTGVAVDGADRVTVGFRLPTYWCAANFAFLMADDMRREVMRLPWVRGVGVELGEHMYADTINRAMTLGLPFQEAFGAEADGNLDAVRQVFLVKSFQRRQLAVLDCLLEQGHQVAALLGAGIGPLRALRLDAEASRLVGRYLERRGVAGPDGDGDPAFVDADGRPVAVADFPAHRRTLRRVSVGVEFNGALCRGLLAARFGEGEHAPPLPAEPTLLDFLRRPAGAGSANGG